MRLILSILLGLWLSPITLAIAQEVKLLPSVSEEKGLFGYSVAQSGDYAAVGAPGEAFDKGAVYVYERDGNNWTEMARLTATDGAFFDRFGWSVALDGDYLAVGAYGCDNRGPNSGGVYIFKRSGSSWTQQVKLLPWGDLPNNNRGAEFGISVALSGNLLLVGAWRDWEEIVNSPGPTPAGPKGFQRGAAYLFNRDGNNWNQMARLSANDADRNDLFGRSVAIDGAFAIVGAPGDQAKGPYSGAAYVFTFSNGTWTQSSKLTANDGQRNRRFGFAVGIDMDGYAAVSSPQDATQGQGSGAVYLYQRSGGSWTQSNKLLPPNGGEQANFGTDLALKDGRLLVGAAGFSGLQPSAGAAFRYQRSGGNWSLDATLSASDGNSQDRFGQSVSLGSGSALIGADRKEGGGAAYEID